MSGSKCHSMTDVYIIMMMYVALLVYYTSERAIAWSSALVKLTKK